MNCSENKRNDETLSESTEASVNQNFTRENIEKESKVRLVDSDEETDFFLKYITTLKRP
jgi:hypothetical protein